MALVYQTSNKLRNSLWGRSLTLVWNCLVLFSLLNTGFKQAQTHKPDTDTVPSLVEKKKCLTVCVGFVELCVLISTTLTKQTNVELFFTWCHSYTKIISDHEADNNKTECALWKWTFWIRFYARKYKKIKCSWTWSRGVKSDATDGDDTNTMPVHS